MLSGWEFESPEFDAICESHGSITTELGRNMHLRAYYYALRVVRGTSTHAHAPSTRRYAVKMMWGRSWESMSRLCRPLPSRPPLPGSSSVTYRSETQGHGESKVQHLLSAGHAAGSATQSRQCRRHTVAHTRVCASSRGSTVRTSTGHTIGRILEG